MLKFLKKIYYRSPKAFLKIVRVTKDRIEFEEIPESIHYQDWRRRQKGKVPLSW
jgi:hypothetical protein